MINKYVLNFFLVLSFFANFGCSQGEHGSKSLSLDQQAGLISIYNDMAKVRFVDDLGSPIANAKVLFGNKIGDFENNFVLSDANGEVLRPRDFDTTTMPLTVQAEGYVRQTVYGLTQSTLTLNLKTDEKRYELKGQVRNLPIKNGDGFIDFALVMPALTKKDLLNFDLNTVMSPYFDTITVASNDINLPSNVSLPKQNERYFISITLDKPIYRTYLKRSGQHKVFAAQGRFPFKAVVDEFRDDKQFFELINYFSITGGALRDVQVANQTTNLDMPANEIKFSKKGSFKAPVANKGEVLVAVAANKVNDYMIPSDVKRLTSGKAQQMNLLENAESYLVTVAKKASEFGTLTPSDRMSAALLKFEEGVQPELLPLIANPAVLERGTKLQIPALAPSKSISALATLLVLSKVQEFKQGSTIIQVLHNEWEVYSPGWITSMSLPEWPEDTRIDGKKRWEVNLIGNNQLIQNKIGQELVEAATHVTHSSVDFK